MRRTGGCRCGALRFALEGPTGPVVHCHCAFCRRVHGAAFTTIAFFPAPAFSWHADSAEPHRWTTPAGNVRHFCGGCATPIYNLAPALDVACLVIGSLARDEDAPEVWFHVNLESMAPWHTIGDDLPRFEGWPDPATIRELARTRPDAWLPAFLRAAG